MPFKSEKQRRYMHANLPEIAKRWERDYAGGGIARVGYQQGMTVAPVPPNNMISNMQKMRPTTLGIMTGQYMPGISPHFGGYGSIDPYGNIQMGLENPDQDFYQSPQGLAFLRNKMGNMFTGAKDFASGIFSGAKNQGVALVGNIMGALSGIPGLGMLLGSMRPDNPYEKFQKQMFSDMYGGYDFGNKDPFGKNIRSLFGNYDVVEQFDKLAGSKIGQKYGYEEAMADGEITEEELAEMQAKGLKGWQLNRLQTLAEAKKRAMNFYNKTKRPPGLDITSQRIIKQPTTTGGGSPTQMARTRQKDLSGGNQKNFGPYQDRASSAAATRSKDLGSMRGGVGRGRSHHFAQGGLASLWQK